MKDVLISLIMYSYIGRVMLMAHDIHTTKAGLYIFQTMKLRNLGDKMIYITAWPIMLMIHILMTAVLSIITDVKMISFVCYEVSSLVLDGPKKPREIQNEETQNAK